MEGIYKTVNIEGSGYTHITSVSLRSGKPRRILCGTSIYFVNSDDDLMSRKKIITEVNTPPTCPRCLKRCIEKLNINNSSKAGKDAIIRTFNQIFSPRGTNNGKCDEIHQKLVPQNHNYPYIPNSYKTIAEYLSTAISFISKYIKHHRLRFLDAGCGIGNIVALASAIGFKAHGIELNEEYLKIARKLTTCMENKPYFECANIITFNKYHMYDLIYYYVPIQDHILQNAFETHLVRKMSVGAFMLPSGSLRGVEHATREGYFKRHIINNVTRIYEKIKEVLCEVL